MSNSSAIACDLTRLTDAERKKHIADAYELFASMQAVTELSDGYAFRLPNASDTLFKLAEFITYDRLCCAFIRYAVVVEQQHGAIWLQLTGDRGVKEYIAAEASHLLPKEIAIAAGFLQLA